MKNLWMRLSVVAGVVVVLVAGAWALAVPIKKMDTTKCPQPACTDPCDPSQYTIGVCQEGPNGPTTPMTYECCCCNEGSKHRYFIGG